MVAHFPFLWQSIEQIVNRADRIRIGVEEIFLYSSTDIEVIIFVIMPNGFVSYFTFCLLSLFFVFVVSYYCNFALIHVAASSCAKLIVIDITCSLPGHISENSASISPCSNYWFNSNSLYTRSYWKCWRIISGLNITYNNKISDLTMLSWNHLATGILCSGYFITLAQYALFLWCMKNTTYANYKCVFLLGVLYLIPSDKYSCIKLYPLFSRR